MSQSSTNPCFEFIEIWLGVISLLIGSIAAWKGICEYQRSNNINRANYIEKLIDRLKMDEEIRDMIYLFQYNLFKYDDSFHGSSLERKVDRMLHYFSYICYLKDKEIIDDDEFECFGIFIRDALENKDLQAYLYCLFHQDEILKIDKTDSKETDTDKKNKYPFNNLISFGLKNKLFKSNITLYSDKKENKDWEKIFLNGYNRVHANQSKKKVRRK